MTSDTEAARRLYKAFNERGPKSILDAMSDDFVGVVSAGMPLGVGGRHEGRDAMLREVWAPAFAAYEVRLDVESDFVAGEVTVAIGNYRGSRRSDGQKLDARFAHVLTIRDGRVCALEQITDTHRWRQA